MYVYHDIVLVEPWHFYRGTARFKIYCFLKSTGVAYRLTEWTQVLCSFRPYHTLLFLVNEGYLVDSLPGDCSPAVTRLVRMASPLKRYNMNSLCNTTAFLLCCFPNLNFSCLFWLGGCSWYVSDQQISELDKEAKLFELGLIYNHGQWSWDKLLPLALLGSRQTRIELHLPNLSTPHTTLKTSSCSFHWLLTLYCFGRGNGNVILKR